MSLFNLVASAALASGVPTGVEVEAPGPSGKLKGTMLAPMAKKRAPPALIIPGSGPTDRDGNSPMGIKAATSRLLAEALAERGIASVRIDKRGMFGSAAAVPDANAVTVPDYVADTRAWIAALRSATGAKCVWLVGHSEGGLVAAAAAREEGVCGLILLAAPGQPVGQALRRQLAANPANAPLLPDAEAAIAALEGGRTVDVSAFHPALQQLFAPQVQGFLRSLLSYDPAALLKDYDRPVLVLQGETDLQVGSEDAKRLAAAAPKAKLALLPGVNHVLKEAPADRAGNMAAYFNPEAPLAAGVAAAVADFILGSR